VRRTGRAAIEPLDETSVLEEIGFELAELLVEKVVCLVDQAEHCVRGDFGWGVFDEGSIKYGSEYQSSARDILGLLFSARVERRRLCAA
jgi:hypothetical protein